jgi:hypothetical protein
MCRLIEVVVVLGGAVAAGGWAGWQIMGWWQ